ncbi:MAG TPA: DUF1559 domain-containing protein [Pirellulales bacterium]|jgi:hypothetical protein|nr:DUF1559 domain-containing protein [Pirellulales bacterium]
MHAAGPALSAPFALIALLFGSVLAPFGVPPLPPDATILQAAPEECVFFAASSGTAQPDAASENHTDQLLATKQVQSFLSQFAAQVAGAIEQYSQRETQLAPLVEIGKPLIETLLSRPAAIYVDRLDLAPGAPPTVVAGLIVNCGERKADVATAVAALEKMIIHDNAVEDVADAKVAGVTLRRFVPAPGVEIHWGFKEDYFLVAIGPSAAAELLGRIGGTAAKPRWMTALEKQAAIKRVSSIRYFDVARLMAAVPTDPNGPFDMRAFWDAAGVGNLASIGNVSGFSTKGMVDRTFLNFKSDPNGLFELLAGKPLTADDLKPVPKTAVFAVALRLDPLQVYKKLTDLAGRIDPKATEQFKQTAIGMTQAFGFRLEEDVLGAFGDVWILHGTVAAGPDQLAGLAATVTVKNKENLLKIQSVILGMMKAQAQAQAPGQGGQLPFTISETKIDDVAAWQLVPERTGAPSPAWAIAGGRLVLGGSLDALKAQLGQGSENGGLAELQAVASRLKTEPILLTYQDSKTLVEQWIALLQAFGPTGTAMLAQQGITFEMPQLPDFKAIAPHVLPRTSTLRIVKKSIVSEAYETVPLVGSGLSAAPAAGLSVAMLMPAIQAAGGVGSRHHSMNNLKQISLAMLNEESARKRFPAAAICDKGGKPLLSWRVKLLPYLGEAELYSQFHLDEPWDSPNNKPLAARVPAAYVNPRLGDLEGKTVYLVPTGKETIFSDDKGTLLRQITDGLSKTILVVEVDADHAVPWTKPEDLAVDENKPDAGLARAPDNGAFVVGFADGSVLALPGDTDPATLWSFFTRAGGEAVIRPGQ